MDRSIVHQYLKENSDAYMREMRRVGVQPERLYATLRNTLQAGFERMVELEGKVKDFRQESPEIMVPGEWLEDLTRSFLQLTTAGAMILELLPKPLSPILTFIEEVSGEQEN